MLEGSQSCTLCKVCSIGIFLFVAKKHCRPPHEQEIDSGSGDDGLLTVLYSKQDREDFVTIDTIRLDFIESTTTVNVRLEASVNHKILVNDPHYIDILPQLKHGGFS